jgi:hypothetical protein
LDDKKSYRGESWKEIQVFGRREDFWTNKRELEPKKIRARRDLGKEGKKFVVGRGDGGGKCVEGTQ